jgi:hypothetical protein
VHRLLRKINVATQLTLLVLLVAGLAAFVVSQAAATANRELFFDRAGGILADECELRGHALRETVRGLAHHVRRSAAASHLLPGKAEAPESYVPFLRQALTIETDCCSRPP